MFKYDKNLVEVSQTSGISKMSIKESYNHENKTVFGWHILKTFGQKIPSRVITIRQKTQLLKILFGEFALWI